MSKVLKVLPMKKEIHSVCELQLTN